MTYPGAVYHVMSRGNGRARLFFKPEDYRLFLETLEEGLEQFGVELLAYCLMPNHYHLALKTPLGNLPRFMAWFQTTFTVRYNRKKRRGGHLFQGRYRAEIVEEGVYGEWLIDYIHLNPVRSRAGGGIRYVGSISDLNRFRWSSHRNYAGLGKEGPKKLNKDCLGSWKSPKAYRQHMEQQLKEEPQDWKEQVISGLVVGSEEMKQKVRRFLKGKSRSMGGGVRRNLELEEVRKRLGHEIAKERDRRNVVWIRIKLMAERPVDLAREMSYRDGGSILQIVKRVEFRAGKNNELKAKLERWKNVSSVED